ncbi:MAG: hypothetical protein E7256_13225 [Lachnospiraceae bacterium]|nr:hypothetical protein [Lachnospiraceae bacterium]
MDLMRVLQDEGYAKEVVAEGEREQKEKKRKQKRGFRLIMAGSLAVGAILGFFLGGMKVGSDSSSPEWSSMVFQGCSLFVFLLGLFIQVVIHEGGHLVFGLMTGYEFLSFRIGSLMVVKKDGKIFWKRYSIQGTGGQCVMRPPVRAEDGEFPYMLYNMGGVIFNFVSATVLGVIGGMAHESIGGQICLIFAAAGVLTGIMNGIPMRMGINNDGMNAKMMKKDKVAKDAFYAQLDVNAKCSDGGRIKDMGEDFYKLSEDVDLSELLVGYQKLLAYDFYAECYDFNKANACIEELEAAKDGMADYLKNAVRVERLFLLILADAPKELITFYYESLKDSAFKAKHDLAAKRVLFAYELLVNKNENAAERVKKEFDKLVLKFPVEGEAMLHQDLVQFVMEHQDIESRKELFESVA